ELKERQKKRYAEGTISREMLVNADGSARLKSLDLQIAEAFKVAQVDLERDQVHFSVGGDGELRSADGSKTYLSMVRSDQYTAAAQRIGSLASDPDSRVFAEEEISEEDLQMLATVKVHAAFYQYLAELETWEVLGDGEFDRAMAVEMRAGD